MTNYREMLEAFLLGIALTFKLAARASAEGVAVGGLASAQGEGSGWQYVPVRVVGRSVQMLSSDGKRATWSAVGLVSEDCRAVTWYGLTFKSDGVVGLRQATRERLTVAALKVMGFSVDAPFSDAWDENTMEMMRTTFCEACGDPLFSARSISDGMGPECSGLAAKRRAKSAAKRQSIAKMTPEEMARMIAERAKRK